MKRIKFFASILLMLCLSVVCCAQTKIDWKQIKNIPDTLEFKNVLLEHLLFKSAYQPVMESIHQGAIYYDNMTERMRIYENGQWRDLSVTIASDSIGAPLTILGYLQANDIYASNTAYIKNGVLATGTSVFDRLKVNNALKVPTVTNTSLGVGSIYYDTSANKLKVLNSSNQWKVVSVDVDSALSSTSTNPVQNKAITAKINQTDANLINGMATTLQQSYNYANGIATQAYNYADSAATDAETASKNYANTQIGILRSYVSQQLGSGTSDLNVNSVKARNASFTDNLQLPFFTGQLGNGLLAYDSSQKHLVLTYREDVNQYASKAIADKHYVDRNYVSDVATGSANGTITVTKNGVSTNVKIAGFSSMVPVGTILPYGGQRAPEGFLICTGSLVAINDYPDLYAVIGHSFEVVPAEEGYFRLPSIGNKFLQGSSNMSSYSDASVGEYVSAGLPNITGEIKSGAFETYDAPTTSAIYTTTSYVGAEGGFQNYGMALDASRCDPIYGNSNTVQPPAVRVKFIIKY